MFSIINVLGSVAKALSGSEQHDDINQTISEAKAKTELYATTDKGIKGIYAKLHRGEFGWLFRLCLLIATPFLIAWAYKSSNRMMKHETDEEIYLRIRNEKRNDYDDEDE
jgi:hypothetical protein